MRKPDDFAFNIYIGTSMSLVRLTVKFTEDHPGYDKYPNSMLIALSPWVLVMTIILIAYLQLRFISVSPSTSSSSSSSCSFSLGPAAG